MSTLQGFKIKIYLYKFFDKFMLIYPLYAVMFADYQMTPMQIAYLFMGWKVTSFVLEFPSGVTADRFSRKNQLVMAELLLLFGYLIWIVMPNFWGFMIGFVLWGAKAAFVSGTLEAFVYDELKAMGEEKSFTKVYGRTSSIAMFAISVAAVLSTFAFQFGGYAFVLATCVLSNAIATIALLTMKEAPITRSTGEVGMIQLAKNGMKEVFGQKALFTVVIFVALISAISVPIEEYMNLIVVDAGLAVAYLGLFTAVWSLMDMTGGILADKFENANEKLHYFFVVLSSVLLLLGAIFMNYWTILFFTIEALLNPIVSVIFEGKTQNLVSSGVRATVSSIRGFMSRLGSVVLIFIVGIISQNGSYKTGFLFLSSLSLIVGLGFMSYTYFKSHQARKHINVA